MSDVVLATRYSAQNYPLALENLAKRYRRTDSDESINYSELGFGDLSEDQASKALRFFADIGLLENPKGANYIPPQSVIDWKLKMGETAEQGKQQVFKKLQDYEVFSELVFILEEGDEQLDDLAEQVGGMVGIDEDELSDMKKTIEVFAACGFLDITEDKTVSLAYSPDDEGAEPAEETEQQSLDETAEAEPHQSNAQEHPTNGGMTDSKPADSTSSPQSVVTQPSLNTELEISIDATEMEPDDLRKKLEIIDEITDNDGE